jgi:hypothetical protein
MYEPIVHEGIFLDYKSENDLLYKDIYSNKIKDIAFVNLYHKNKFATMAYVWCDNEMNGREYIEINHTVVYLDTIKTLVSIEATINHICNQYDTTLEELQSDSKVKTLAEPRNILYYLLRHEYGMNYQAIADMFHRLSHATVISGAKKISGYMEIHSRYANSINALLLTEVRHQAELEMHEL